MDKSLFRYVWTHSRRDQIALLIVVLAQLPFYFFSLDLPKRIVNDAILGQSFQNGQAETRAFVFELKLPDWLGGVSFGSFDGVMLDRVGLLFALSGIFLALVMINGGFKYWINVAKGALGERMLRRLRFDLVSTALRFTPDTLRKVKPSEAATMVKDEVEPIGGFIGDAFIQPVFLGTQALTALVFIFVQNVWLGLIAGSIVAVQFAVIPRLRRIQIRLGRQRQLASRQLAGRVAEIVDGMEAVHVHNATRWERAEIAWRLHDLFDLRFRIFKWKFMVKFLNNLLAQITPFLFYAVGGYLAIKGDLDIGQLVAAIAAYRDLPPPLKELIDWDQMRLDVQVKYEQVLEQFTPDSLIPLDLQTAVAPADRRLTGPLVFDHFGIADSHGVVLEPVSARVDLPAQVALVGDTAAPSMIARAFARRIPHVSGRILVGNDDLMHLPDSVIWRQLAYANADPYLFPGSVRDNLIYGLRRVPVEVSDRRRVLEAQRTGNPIDDPHADWVDYQAAGVSNASELDRHLIDILALVGMRGDLYQFGLFGQLDAGTDPDEMDAFIAARRRLEERFRDPGRAKLLERFSQDAFGRNVKIGENILFGTLNGMQLSALALAEAPMFRRALDETGLTPVLVGLGLRIARETIDIFRDLPAGHPLFEQFSFIAAEEISEFDEILRRTAARGERALRNSERVRLVALTLNYVEAKHRLGLVDEELEAKVLVARQRFRELAADSGKVTFHDPDRMNLAAPLRDNLLFGRIAHGVADAERRVMAEVMDVIDELNLRDAVERIGLNYAVGPGGRLLSSAQRIKINLARCLVRNPDILILDGAVAPLGDAEAAQVMGRLRQRQAQKTLIAVVREESSADFDLAIRCTGTRAEIDLPTVPNDSRVRETAAT